MADVLTRIESFPFDSKFDGYDSEGYPIYDRAVGSRLLRVTFNKFFTDGVFPSPSSCLQITRVPGSYAVNIGRGVGIINGAIGGVFDEDGLNIVLTQEPPRGNICYSIFLRYDENVEFRSLYIRVAETVGTATPAMPDSGPGIKELRLGHISTTSGAENFDTSTLVDERGTSVCPFAAPFEELDLSSIITDAKYQVDYWVEKLGDYYDEHIDFIQAAIDDTMAGYLQGQIDAMPHGGQITAEEVDIMWGESLGDTVYVPMTDQEIDALFE